MSSGWRQSYLQLRDFVAGHPEIEIGETVTRIPEHLRPEFYHLFDETRTAFVEERFPYELSEANRLSKGFFEVKREVGELLKLDHVSVSDDLGGFLRNPRRSLTQELFDSLFNLLKGKTSIRAFEEEASRKLETSLEKSCRRGYEKWIELSLMRLLDPDRIMNIPILRPGYIEKVRRSFPLKEPIPIPQESKHISLYQETLPTFIIPDFIIHSTKIGRFVAIRSGLEDAMWVASNPSERRQWYLLEATRKRCGLVSPRPALSIYLSRAPEDIALIADSLRICRPDMIIECMTHGMRKEDADMVKLHRDVLRPKLGVFVVSGEHLPKGMRQSLGRGVHLLTVGFNRLKLGRLVNSLAGPKRGRKPQIR